MNRQIEAAHTVKRTELLAMVVGLKPVPLHVLRTAKVDDAGSKKPRLVVIQRWVLGTFLRSCRTALAWLSAPPHPGGKQTRLVVVQRQVLVLLRSCSTASTWLSES